MKEEVFGVITFDSTHHAINAENKLKKEELNFKTIPTPREITSSCGLSIRFDLEIVDSIKKVMNKSELAINGIYKLIKRGTYRRAEKL